jgi:hypothetical protein
MLLVVPLSLVAAFLFAAAAAFQQRAAHLTARASAANGRTTPASGVRSWLPVLGFLDDLLRHRLWLLGWAANLVGFLIQAAALHLGSIAVVQPLLVAQLLFALPLSVASSRCRLLPRDWIGATSICGGLAILLAVRGVAPPAARATRTHVLLATAAGLGLVVLLVAAGRRYYHAQPQLRAALQSVAAGICFAMTAVFITLTADDLINRGVGETAIDWPGYALAGSTLLGLLLEQDAFAAGSLATAVAAMTITNPIASYALGVLAFEVDAPSDPGALAGLASAGLLIVIGVITLSGSPTVRDQYVRAEEGAGVQAGEPCAEPAEPAAGETGAAGGAPVDGTMVDGTTAGQVPERAETAETGRPQPNRRARLR